MHLPFADGLPVPPVAVPTPPVGTSATVLDTVLNIAQIVLIAAGLIGIANALIVRPLLGRPKLTIQPKPWKADVPVPWTFAAVDLRNKPLPKWLSWLVDRRTAVDVEVHLEFRRKGEAALLFPPVPARWSHKPQPLQVTPVRMLFNREFAHDYIPVEERVGESMTASLAPSHSPEEIAVAVLRVDGTAHAWGARSYFWPGWRNPSWELPHGEYDITVIARWADQEERRRVSLTFLGPAFENFDAKA